MWCLYMMGYDSACDNLEVLLPVTTWRECQGSRPCNFSASVSCWCAARGSRWSLNTWVPVTHEKPTWRSRLLHMAWTSSEGWRLLGRYPPLSLLQINKQNFKTKILNSGLQLLTTFPTVEITNRVGMKSFQKKYRSMWCYQTCLLAWFNCCKCVRISRCHIVQHQYVWFCQLKNF